jgi:membrane-bound lytic murein transglycosylase D
VPTELVWLAEVESSFDPSARSPAGAVGLFQLMPATAKSLDLSLWPWDERRNPEKSARAAAVYLRSLHKRFDDWPLALAAYNAGEGRVSDLLRKRKARSFDAISDALPAETQMYVPKVEATVLKREGRTLAQLKSP